MTTPAETIAALGLTMKAHFVAHSQSRNAKPVKKIGDLTLNWNIVILKGERTILTVKYSTGVAHAPSYTQGSMTNDEWEAVKGECETGKKHMINGPFGLRKTGVDILPKIEDVFYSLAMDSSVLDEASFEEWASSLGYDTDSRKAEEIYRECLREALALRGAIGEAGLEKLHAAFQDY